MAKPKKEGIEYFPLDVDFMGDAKVIALGVKCAARGVLGYVTLLTEIYRCGYFVRVSEGLLMAVAEKIWCKQSVVMEIIKVCVSCALFDRRLWDTYGILTSARIQETYLSVAKRLKRDIDIAPEYNLLHTYEEVQQMLQTIQTVDGIKQEVRSEKRKGNSKTEDGVLQEVEFPQNDKLATKNDKLSKQGNFNSRKNALIRELTPKIKENNILPQTPTGGRERENENFDFDKFVIYWNKSLSNLAPFSKITSKQREALLHYRREFGSKEVGEALKWANQQDFYAGRGRSTRKGIGYILQEDNFQRLYDDWQESLRHDRELREYNRRQMGML